MTQFIDRRLNGKNRSTVNRQRFIRRFKNQIKAAVSEAIQKRSIKDIESGEQIIIPHKDVSEPIIHHGSGGKREYTIPGNKEYARGDRLKRPDKSSGNEGEDSQASNQGEGLDDFSFYLTKEEFLDLFFEELALPDMIKTRLAEIPSIETVRAGFSTTGTPPNINILRSFRNALSRRLAFHGGYDNAIAQLELEKQTLQAVIEQLKNNDKNENNKLNKVLTTQLRELKIKIELVNEKIATLSQKKSLIPFIDSFDLRYTSRVKRPKITTQAVMFCIMDVSGSMDETKKDIAKRFFILLYLFLVKAYQKIQIVFIRHHTTAKEVDEQEFFYSRETGGTVVSSALELVKKIIIERYPTADWNIYIAQASDGDNWNADSPLCSEILKNFIMPYVQYYAYVEIMPRHHQSLWRTYTTLQEEFTNFSMRAINELKDIYPVFHELFRRKNT